MLGSRCRQSITGAGPSSFVLVDDAGATNTQSVRTVFGTDNSALLTIYDSTTGIWTHVEAKVPSSDTSSLTILRTIRNSSGTASPVTFTNTGNKVVFSGEMASDVLSYLVQCPATSGTATAYTVSYAPAPVSLANNVAIRFRAHAANTGACTLAVNGLPAWPIRKGDGTAALTAGDIPASAVVSVMPEPASEWYVLLSVAPTLPKAWLSGSAASGKWRQTPDGVIEQWGSVVVTLNSNGDGAISWPLAFPTACDVPIIASGDVTTSGNLVIGPNSAGWNTTGANISARPNPGAVTLRVNYRAIGY